jgi:hypothetical protein
MERTGGANVADGADEVRLRARAALAGRIADKTGGRWRRIRPADYVDMLTFRGPELLAGVEAAAGNTYAAADAYPPVAIQRAIAADVSPSSMDI